MKKIHKEIISFVILILFVGGLIFLFNFISPTEIVDKLGTRNGYILAFVVSFFGGFSAGGSVSFITVLITLASGGLNPIYLGLVAGTSLATGDMIMFYVGSRGRKLVKGKWDKRIDKVAKIVKDRKWLEKLIPFIAFIYIGFIPLPNDVLILFLAAIEYPYKKLYPAIMLGDLTFAILIASLGASGFLF